MKNHHISQCLHANLGDTVINGYHLEQHWQDICSRGRKIDEIFKDLPNVFSIADDILAAGYESDGKDHDKTVWKVLQRCRQVNPYDAQKYFQYEHILPSSNLTVLNCTVCHCQHPL